MTINKKTARIQKNADNELFKEIKNIIQESRFTVSNLVNSNLTMLFWNIGNRIKKEILKGSRAEYGKEIVANISLKLISEFGNSYSVKNLWRMIQFVEIFPNKEKVVSLIRHLSWTHFIALLPLKDELQREFYIELCRLEKWSVRILRKQINSMLYERTALSRKPVELINYEIQELKDNDFIDKDIVLKDPYILDFLGLKDRYLEKDLEDAILIEMENFILELGIGFAFIARQKRIQIDNEDFFIDLLFYNRKLNRLVVIDLKIGEFKAEFKGQMELYLRWLDKYEKQDNEKSPLGLILCSGKKSEQIELLELDKAGIHVAEYLTVLPSKEQLSRKLNNAIALSKHRYILNKE